MCINSFSFCSFNPQLDYMKTNHVKLGAGSPKQKGTKVVALLYAKAKSNNDMCNAGASKRKRTASGKSQRPSLVF